MKRLLSVIVAFVMFVSCTTETDVTTDTVIRNESKHIVTFTVYGPHKEIQSYELDNGEEAIETRVDMGGVDIFILSADSIHIFYNNTHVQKYRNNPLISAEHRNPFNVDSYELITEKESKKSYYNRYTYTITEDDFNNSMQIE